MLKKNIWAVNALINTKEINLFPMGYKKIVGKRKDINYL